MNKKAAISATAIVLTVAAVFAATARYPIAAATAVVIFFIAFVWAVIYYLFTIK